MIPEGWTTSKFNTFVKSLLRKGSMRFPERGKALNHAYVGQKINESSGRLAKHYMCAECKGEFPMKQVDVDHINPIVPVTGFVSWDDVIHRLFCSHKEMQILCKTCHKAKCKEENAIRRSNKNG